MGKTCARNSMILCIILLLLLFFPDVSACKDIIVCGNATEGEYNLLLKVRDPSRPGYQVLCMIPEGYQYEYHHPWTGEEISIITSHKYIGVTSRNDTPPAIVKSGMVLTDAGLAFGDADSLSRWVNPTKYAWDDFDWIRYACEQADSTKEAVELLTIDVVDTLHAPGVSENLFVLGSDKGYVIEADAYHYHIKEIVNGYDVISNYPRELWNTQFFRTLPIAASFDMEKQQLVKKGNIITLNSLQGIQFTNVTETSVSAKQIPFFTFISYQNGKPVFIKDPVTITLGNRETVGDYSVTILDIQGSSALVHVETVHHAWQRHMEQIIEPALGSITVQDMMEWARLNESMLNGLRPMCEPKFIYEGSAIYKIPKEYPHILGNGWFAANHAHSSIFIPFHICNIDIFEPYGTGEVAVLGSQLSQTYFDKLQPLIRQVENVFLFENHRLEQWAVTSLDNNLEVALAITLSDISMQYQAWMLLQIYKEIATVFEQQTQEDLLSRFKETYNESYTASLYQMKEAFFELQKIQGTEFLQKSLTQIVLNITKTSIDLCHASGIPCPEAERLFEQGSNNITQGYFDEGFDSLILSYLLSSDCFYNSELYDEAPSLFIHLERAYFMIFSVIAVLFVINNKKWSKIKIEKRKGKMW